MKQQFTFQPSTLWRSVVLINCSHQCFNGSAISAKRAAKS